jgi:predicted porin
LVNLLYIKSRLYLFYAGYKLDDYNGAGIGQYGIGVSYQLNPSTNVGLSYNVFDFGDAITNQNFVNF